MTLSVLHGGFNLNRAGLITIAGWVEADDDGVQPLKDQEAGVTLYQNLTLQGTLGQLNTALRTLIYYGDENFNTHTVAGIPTTLETLTILVDDLGFTDVDTPIGGERINAPTRLMDQEVVTLTVRPTNDAPVITVPAGLSVTLDEDDKNGLLVKKVGTNPPVDPDAWISVSDLDDLLDPRVIELQVTLSVLHGGLTITPTNLLVTASKLASEDGVQPAVQVPAITTYQSLTLQGTIANLNDALKTLKYYNDEHFNTQTLPANAEVLQIDVDDLGYTDQATPIGSESATALTRMFDQELVALTIRPTRDAPQITVPAGLSAVLDEDDANGLLIKKVGTDPITDPDAWITVADLDDAYDPRATELQLTLAVLHGGLTINRTNLITVALQPAGADGEQPAAQVPPIATYQSLTLRGTIPLLNAALQTLKYYNDEHFNTQTPLPAFAEVLSVSVNDLGYTDWTTPIGSEAAGVATEETDQESVLLTVRPTNDVPEIDLSNLATTPPNATVGEDAAAGLAFAGIRVLDRDDLHDPADILLQVTVDVLHGGLVMDETGVNVTNRVDAAADGAFPDPNHVAAPYQALTFTGTLLQLNAALATLRYYSDLDFSTGAQSERLAIEVNDLGNTDYRTPGYPVVSEDPAAGMRDRETIAITVTTLNDPPVAADDTVNTAEDTRLTVTAAALLANDRPGPANESSQTLRMVVGGFGPAGHGTVSFDGVRVIYTPDPDYNGPDTFTYTIDDGDSASTDVGTVSVTVTAVDDPPVAVDDNVLPPAAEETPQTISAASVAGQRPSGTGQREHAGRADRAQRLRHGVPWHRVLGWCCRERDLHASRELQRHGHLHLHDRRWSPSFHVGGHRHGDRHPRERRAAGRR